MSTYENFVLRNAGFIPAEIQRKIRDTRILIAGCGVGSYVAEAAVRLGFTHLVLCDADTVALHNLNRQDYLAGDVGRPKAATLAKRLQAISPEIDCTAHGMITPANVAGFVEHADFIVDTIDFLDLAAIVAVHDEAKRQKKKLITAMGMGFGAAAMYIPPESEWTFRRIFKIPENSDLNRLSYTSLYSALMAGIADRIDPQVAAVMAKALTVMEDGRPCPASQVAPGGMAVASLVTTLIVRVLAQQPVVPAPALLTLDMGRALTNAGLDLST